MTDWKQASRHTMADIVHEQATGFRTGWETSSGATVGHTLRKIGRPVNVIFCTHEVAVLFELTCTYSTCQALGPCITKARCHRTSSLNQQFKVCFELVPQHLPSKEFLRKESKESKCHLAYRRNEKEAACKIQYHLQ